MAAERRGEDFDTIGRDERSALRPAASRCRPSTVTRKALLFGALTAKMTLALHFADTSRHQFVIAAQPWHGQCAP
ncbi:hypothetical protein [Sphingopyxis sp.]|uniref:hypothetical protein n=1 Tax=Sphingopyxis sp. TaxID=1908224 RepID=UPI003F6EC6E4